MVMASEAYAGRFAGYGRRAGYLSRWAARVAAARKVLTSVWVLGPALVGSVVILALALVYLHVACLDTGHRILAGQKQLQELEAENQRLQLRVWELTSPDRIEKIARERLGMVRPQAARVLEAGAGERLASTEPGEADRAPGTAAGKRGWLREAQGWLRELPSSLARLVEGQGALAGPAR